MCRHPDRSSVSPRAALTGDQHRSALAAPGVTWGQGVCVASSLAAGVSGCAFLGLCISPRPRPQGLLVGSATGPDVGTPCLSESKLNVAPHAAQKQDSQSGRCYPGLENYRWAVALRAGA